MTIADTGQDTALIPVHAATSRSAQKAYLGTALFGLTSLILLCVSTVAYWVFYYNYVPQIGLEKGIHLQFGDGPPYGSTSLAQALASQQAYEVSLFLNLPRTPANRAAGNFMIDLSLLAPSRQDTPLGVASKPLRLTDTSPTILARSRRPGILTYTSNVVDTVNTMAGLPWYVLGWAKESETLEIVMFEDVQFPKGSATVPDTVHISIEADEKMQFYEAGVRIVARLGGLRWFLYHHRIISFLIFATTFWSSAMISMIIMWLLLGLSGSSSVVGNGIKSEDGEAKSTNGRLKIKTEAAESDDVFDPTSLEDLSDTSRSFPTVGRQMPLHFPGRKKSEPKIKEEERSAMSLASMIPHEADDEDEDGGQVGSEWRDSGIGTSREEEKRDDLRRRR